VPEHDASLIFRSSRISIHDETSHMTTFRIAATCLVTVGLCAGCGGGGDLPVAPTAEEAKKAMEAAGPDAAAKAEPGVLKKKGKFGETTKKVDTPAPASPL
jgi:hypothetical protein